MRRPPPSCAPVPHEGDSSIRAEAAVPVVIGGTVGLLAGLGLSRVLESVLFGVSPLDPAALLAALLIVVGGAVAAGVVPARRASRADPNAVLHYE